MSFREKRVQTLKVDFLGTIEPVTLRTADLKKVCHSEHRASLSLG